MGQAKRCQVVLLDPRKLRDDPQNGHLGHEITLLVLFVVNSHERPDKVKLREELVDRHSYRLKRVHSVIVFDQLIMRPAHPGETEQVAKRWIDEHGEDVS